MSRQAWDEAIAGGRVKVGGRPLKKGGAEVPAHTEIVVDLAELGLVPAEAAPELLWCAEDGSFAVFNKSAGEDSYPLYPWERGTFANRAARFAVERFGMPAETFARLAAPPILEGGLVQRLDRDTSGILCSAFTPAAKSAYRRVFSGEARKGYLALVGGRPRAGSFAVFFGPGEQSRVRAERAARPGFTEAELRVSVLAQANDLALVAIETSHGLRHVVRAGMAALGHPLVGDALYGGTPAAPFHQLHGSWLRLPNLPEFRAPPPESFLSTARALGLEYFP